MKRDVITLVEERTETRKACNNCVHRYNSPRQFWRCSRIGMYTEVEMQFGGKCNIGGRLLLWEPRKGVLQKLLHLLMRGKK